MTASQSLINYLHLGFDPLEVLKVPNNFKVFDNLLYPGITLKYKELKGWLAFPRDCDRRVGMDLTSHLPVLQSLGFHLVDIFTESNLISSPFLIPELWLEQFQNLAVISAIL